MVFRTNNNTRFNSVDCKRGINKSFSTKLTIVIMSQKQIALMITQYQIMTIYFKAFSNISMPSIYMPILCFQILKNISWYTERTIAEISLGGLLILVIIRTIQYNMLRMRDKYLHTNCLAALANMSSECFFDLIENVLEFLKYTHEVILSQFESLDN